MPIIVLWSVSVNSDIANREWFDSTWIKSRSEKRVGRNGRGRWWPSRRNHGTGGGMSMAVPVTVHATAITTALSGHYVTALNATQERV